MQLLEGRLVYSASDINNSLACAHLVALERGVACRERTRPEIELPVASILRRLGEDHERKYLELLEARGVPIVRIERGDGAAGLRVAAQATERAMRDGAPVIYQAAFFDGEALGYADFLRRVERPSPNLGTWSYEVADTKLAGNSQPYFLLQLCFYSECVARVQGCDPLRTYVVLGDGREEPYDVADFAAHFRAVRARFLIDSFESSQPTAPYPVPHCDLCVWQKQCRTELERADHLCLVATMRRSQVAKLNGGGIGTLAQLAAAPNEARPPSLGSATFERLRDQARLQREQRIAMENDDPNPYRFEPLAMHDDDGRPCGALALPEGDEGDVYFDMEGDPYYVDAGRWFGASGGLEYLFGAHLPHEGEFKAFWGCDRGDGAPHHRLAERRAFVAFVDFLLERRARYPNSHVYHYAPYEKTALLRLAARHGTRADEVDDLIKSGYFVDLYHIVKRSVMVGQPRYGLKFLEPFYEKSKREGVAKADDSIVAFEDWLVAREHGHDERALLNDIEQYNRYDCESTAHLCGWLRAVAANAGEAAPPQPAEAPKPPGAALVARRLAIAALQARLRDGLPEEVDERELEALPSFDRLRYLLAAMLDYYTRESKPGWWEFHNRCDLYDAGDVDTLVERDSTVLAGLELRSEAGGIVEMTYPPQEHKAEPGPAFDLATRKPCGSIVELDDERRIVRIKGKTLPKAIYSHKFVSTQSLEDALVAIAGRLLAAGTVPNDAVADMLLRRFPRRVVGTVGPLQPATLDPASVCDAIRSLDDSYLAIQGPPGTGKTDYSARAILDLLREGKRIGVLAPSHKVAHNLLDRIGAFAVAAGQRFYGVHKATESAPESFYAAAAGSGTFIDNVAKDVVFDERLDLCSGTAWLFAKAPDRFFDYLFVDEAGQLPLASIAAASKSARNVVLVGDPQQLAQVSKTSHPAGLGFSVLEYLLAGEPTVDERQGILLDVSYRMQREVCAFVSAVSYRNKLHEDPKNNAQRVDSAGLSGAGLRYMPVAHAGNRAASLEEAERIAAEIALLLHGTLVDRDGAMRRIGPQDIIVVTPFNGQRRLLAATIAARVGVRVDVGTVNKFQGRQAHVVFYSMATSSGDEMPRSADFLFERNRLNVAISRARAMAVLVCSPELLRAPTPSIESLRLLNALDLFVERAGYCPAAVASESQTSPLSV